MTEQRDERCPTALWGRRLKHQYVEIDELPRELLAALEEPLGVAIPPGSDLDWELRFVGWCYKDQSRGETGTVRSARRRRMLALAKGLRATFDAHDVIELGDLPDIVQMLATATWHDFMILADQLEQWTPLIEELAQRRLTRGREDNDRLRLCCEALRLLYEGATGHRASHTSLDHVGVETAKPQSPFGRFVLIFFQHVDPDSVEKLNEVLRKLSWPSRKVRPARAKTLPKNTIRRA
ncbi:MAG: hypothetical protein R3E04_10950 [Sphingobium sp.]